MSALLLEIITSMRSKINMEGSEYTVRVTCFVLAGGARPERDLAVGLSHYV